MSKLKYNTWRPVTITTIADEKYLDHLLGFLYSLDQTNPSYKVHAHLVRVGSYIDADIRKLHKHTVITHDDTVYDDRPNRPPNPDAVFTDGKLHIPHPRLVSDKMCYIVQKKYDNIVTNLKDGAGAVLAIDADTIFRKDISPLIDLIYENDITIMDNITEDSIKYNKKRAGWKEGMIGVCSSKNTLAFFERVKRIIRDSGGPRSAHGWVIEDRALSMAYYEMKLKRGHLPVTFKDADLQNSSHIWSGTGKTKYKNKKYLKEMKKYEEGLNNRNNK